MTDMILHRLQSDFGWPSEAAIFNPAGEAAASYARLAEQKIGQTLRRMAGRDGVDVGVLLRDPGGEASDVPIAVVCRFTFVAAPALLAEAHRLAWNFCHAPILVTIDPVELRSWSCFVAPALHLGHPDPTPASLGFGIVAAEGALSEQAADALHWISLMAGEPERLRPELFDPGGRADRSLLENLKHIRGQLITGDRAVPADIAHDLIARLMFIQFLFDRRDSSGYAALDAGRLRSLFDEHVLACAHETLADLLSHYDDSYRLFRWLNERFNGDLFPGKSSDPDEREREWQREMQVVEAHHLGLLADLVSGRITASSGQWAIWRLYAFDSIPLEFVSCIYEEFVSVSAEKTKRAKGAPKSRKPGSAHYTPAHLADYVLDAVLPWDGDGWQVRILDPSCGSGIFLVRAFQRLIHRWRRGHAAKEVPVGVLQALLTQCLCGIDVNAQAIRVASFSLYLAMCDEIEPRRYWTEVRFPPLRGETLVTTDFFLADRSGVREEPFDIVVGNAPWGKNTATAPAVSWASDQGIKVHNNDIGPLFLFAGLEWLKPGGRLAMIQPVTSILTGAKSSQARSYLAERYRIEEITNFTLLRFNLFKGATSPACSVVVHKEPPNGEPATYICPKVSWGCEDDYRISFDHLDVNHVHADQLADPVIWNVLVTGGMRDVALVRKIARQSQSLRDLDGAEDFIIGEGVIVGNQSTSPAHLRDRLVLSGRSFPPGTDGELDPTSLTRQRELAVERGRTPDLFKTPQLIIKQGFDRKKGGFSSAIVKGEEGVVCTQSYVSIHARSPAAARALVAIRDSVNSPVLSYYLGLTSGRMTYRPELLAAGFEGLPVLPEHLGLSALKQPERALVEDAHRFAIPALLRSTGPANDTATSRAPGQDPLHEFCDYYLRVLSPTGKVGPNATIYRESGYHDLPMRLVAIHLSPLGEERIRVETLGAGLLRTRLLELHRLLAGGPGSMQNRRVATIYDTCVHPQTGAAVPTVYLVRPDRDRFWSRSAALREADRLVADGIFGSMRQQGGHTDER